MDSWPVEDALLETIKQEMKDFNTTLHIRYRRHQFMLTSACYTPSKCSSQTLSISCGLRFLVCLLPECALYPSILLTWHTCGLYYDTPTAHHIIKSDEVAGLSGAMHWVVDSLQPYVN
jgi:hypothetical protein